MTITVWIRQWNWIGFKHPKDGLENNRIRHSVTMYGHLDDCFIRISKILPQYIPEQIENQQNFNIFLIILNLSYKKYLDEEAPPINYERIFETYEKLQAININTCYISLRDTNKHQASKKRNISFVSYPLKVIKEQL
ncbi:hypothetical protein RhiirA1_397686 [Rhizophagus irregularis]|uniref:Uncharacterized protein n=1 Tax=Rhizophagus irregularis TaxID=588596 RepID=A0A2N0RGC2_9GLOM|nr:hypothetical protein RhiirA1_397686 [Rhizophagus irregularis]